MAHYLHNKYYILCRKDQSMNLGWICGFFVGILGIISHFTYIHMASEYNYWLLVIGFFLVSLSGPRRF